MGRHSKKIDMAKQVAALCAQIVPKDKVKTGRIRVIKGSRSAERKVKLADAVTGNITTGVRLEVRQPGAIQTITVVTGDAAKTTSRLKFLLQEHGIAVCS